MTTQLQIRDLEYVDQAHDLWRIETAVTQGNAERARVAARWSALFESDGLLPPPTCPIAVSAVRRVASDLGRNWAGFA